jgi:hypothetical protein
MSSFTERELAYLLGRPRRLTPASHGRAPSQRRPSRDLFDVTRRKPMSNLQAVADRFEIETLRGEFTDAGVMRDYNRFASLFTQDGVWRIPDSNAEFVRREEIRAGMERLQGFWDYFVQNAHPGTIRLEGDTVVGRAYIPEFGRLRDGSSHLNYCLYHERYHRAPDGRKSKESIGRAETRERATRRGLR